MTSTSAQSPVYIRSKNGTPLYERKCSGCGTVSAVDRRSLNKKCHDCAMKDRRKHGLATKNGTHPLYKLLNAMIARCKYPSATNYKYYGGRGISVCKEWTQSPEAFVKWARENGWEPGLEIDRIDNDGNYCPENCRFVTHQHNSQRRSHITTTAKQAKKVRDALSSGLNVSEAAKSAGVSYMVAWHINASDSVWGNVR